MDIFSYSAYSISIDNSGCKGSGIVKENISGNLNNNITNLDNIFKDCNDILKREFEIGIDEKKKACAYFVETAVSGITMQELLLGVTDTRDIYTVDDAVTGVLIGDAVIFIEGEEKAVQVKSNGYPGMGINEAENEQTMRGSKEAFSDSEKSNTALIRKRIRSVDLKVVERKIGKYSNTNVAVVYMESIVRPQVLDEVKQKLDSFTVDGVMDSGIIEQLIEQFPYSPFPQYQVTERPDKAAMAVLDGRIVILSDNSPDALILPVNYGSFFNTPDDYYRRFEISSFTRMIRYISAFLAMVFPAFYLAVIKFHTELLPTELALAFAEARMGVPFSAFAEVIVMELSFELIREAGVRIPGPMGSTIGIVGGLIVGQAAVEANLVSPIIVIVVAITALCSFAVPNEEFSSAFRIIKYFVIVLAAFFGLYGCVIGMLAVLIHLAGLNSFHFPYLGPEAAGEINRLYDRKDFLVKYPAKKLKFRNMFSTPDNRKKMERK